jgi:predicted nuclease of restriction endonuclease-like (RecB) superfamily
MTKNSPQSKRTGPFKSLAVKTSEPVAFDEVVRLIEASRVRAMAVVNTALIDLYWSIGEYISRRIAADGWGKGTVESLAEHIQRSQPGMTGFSARNLWRMMQFYEIYSDQPKLAALVRELPWRHNLLIMGRCKRPEEREFYLSSLSGNIGLTGSCSGKSTGHFLKEPFLLRQNCQQR